MFRLLSTSWVRVFRATCAALLVVASAGCGDPVAEQVKAYRAQLSGGPPPLRIQAIWMLRGLGTRSAPAIPDLIRTLRESDPHYRAPAAMALSAIDPTGVHVLPALREALQDRHPEVRAFAARSIGNLGPAGKPAVPDLTPLSQDTHFMTRQMALFALWRITGEAAHFEAVLKLASDSPPQERSLAVYLLGDSGNKDPRVVQALVRAAGSPQRAVRLEGVQGLGKLGPAAEPGIDALFRAFHEEDGAIHNAASAALVALDKTGVKLLPGLIASLNSRSSRVRVQSAYALGTFGSVSKPAIPALRRTLRDGDPEVRGEAARTLGILSADAGEALPDLVGMLSDRVPQTAWIAAESLARFGQAPPALLTAARTGPPETRRRAVFALSQMKSRPVAATELLRELASDPDLEIQNMARLAVSGEPAGKR